jgi:hypothetical protein
MARTFVKSALISAAIAALFLVAAPVEAATTTWDTGSNSNIPSTCPTQTSTLVPGSGTTSTTTTFCQSNAGVTGSGSGVVSGVFYGNQFTYTNGGQTLTATAFYVNQLGSTGGNGGTKFQTANLEAYSPGLGVSSYAVGANGEAVGVSPGHTMDNQGGVDAILFKLPSANYNVTSLTLSLFGGGNFNYYIGSASAVTNLTTLTLAGLTTANGWTNGGEVVTNASCNSSGGSCTGTTSSSNDTITIANVASSDVNISKSNVVFNATGVTGQYLLVMAAVGETTDDIKIAAVSGAPGSTKVPEPSTLALFGTAGLIALRLRRRRQAA